MQPLVDFRQFPVPLRLVSESEVHRNERPPDVLEEYARVLGGVGELEVLHALQSGKRVAYFTVAVTEDFHVLQLEVFNVGSLEDALR